MESSTDSESEGTATSVDSAALINYMLSKMLESGNIHLVVSELVPILEQLDFVIEVEGDYKSGGGFEPHIKIRVSRNASKFNSSYSSSPQSASNVLLDSLSKLATTTASNNSNTFTWTDVSSDKNNGSDKVV